MKHNGQKCPVPEGTLIDVKFRDGEIRRGVKALIWFEHNAGKPPYGACSAHWFHDDMPNDIVEYQLHTPLPPSL